MFLLFSFSLPLFSFTLAMINPLQLFIYKLPLTILFTDTSNGVTGLQISRSCHL
ncbi:hypothetical protein L873DRAFT_1818841 [Choiromyces venosus 120613-1]|uniref:Uncharacterized protein n=1 Tax=Choiromyces venosus 120613-1 TaxID=1336337 RepID=A0A3N4J5D5_9PEZI|nr:hypothetical protein L873DRAFT_1818841 [Choiromyces venosus 120613-1]